VGIRRKYYAGSGPEGAQVIEGIGGAGGVRTRDLLDAIEARSQLRYGPTECKYCYSFYSTLRLQASKPKYSGVSVVVRSNSMVEPTVAHGKSKGAVVSGIMRAQAGA
jgi:hypothetical protein